jgi:hypothetical protein
MQVNKPLFGTKTFGGIKKLEPKKLNALASSTIKNPLKSALIPPKTPSSSLNPTSTSVGGSIRKSSTALEEIIEEEKRKKQRFLK